MLLGEQLLLLLVFQELSFFVDHPERFKFVHISVKFIDLVCLFVDEFVETKKNQKFFFQSVQKFEYVLAIMELIDIDFHSLECGIHSELQLF